MVTLMKILVQRVSKATISVNNEIISSIEKGILAFVGISGEDDNSIIPWLANKLVHLRIFPDDHGKMNQSVIDIAGSILLVSQFTLCAETSKGRRPDFFKAADPNKANKLFFDLCEEIKQSRVEVKTGVFGANMQVHLINDGPVTLMLEKTAPFC